MSDYRTHADDTSSFELHISDDRAVGAQVAVPFYGRHAGYTYPTCYAGVITNDDIVADHGIGQNNNVIANTDLIADGHMLKHHHPLAQRRHSGDTRRRMDDGFEPLRWESRLGDDRSFLSEVVLAADAIHKVGIRIVSGTLQRAEHLYVPYLLTPLPLIIIQEADALVLRFVRLHIPLVHSI